MRTFFIFVMICLCVIFFHSCDMEFSSENSSGEDGENAGGSGWTSMSVNAPGHLLAVNFVDNNTGFICGESGFLTKTSDAGASWQTLTTGKTADINDCDGFGSVIVAVGDSGTILYSSDSGNTLQEPVSPPTTVNLNGIDFSDGSNGIAVGGGGVIIYTNNGGAGWSVARGQGSGNDLLDVSFFKGTGSAVAVGSGGGLFYTSDYGQNWIAAVPGIGRTQDFKSAHFVTATVAYAVAYAGTVYKTVDAGVNWSKVGYDNVSYLEDVVFFSENTGYILGDKGKIIKTEDGGGDWTLISDDLDAIIYGGDFIDAGTGFVVGKNGAAYKSSTVGQ